MLLLSNPRLAFDTVERASMNANGVCSRLEKTTEHSSERLAISDQKMCKTSIQQTENIANLRVLRRFETFSFS